MQNSKDKHRLIVWIARLSTCVLRVWYSSQPKGLWVCNTLPKMAFGYLTRRLLVDFFSDNIIQPLSAWYEKYNTLWFATLKIRPVSSPSDIAHIFQYFCFSLFVFLFFFSIYNFCIYFIFFVLVFFFCFVLVCFFTMGGNQKISFVVIYRFWKVKRTLSSASTAVFHQFLYVRVLNWLSCGVLF